MNNIKIAFFDIDGTLRDINSERISKKVFYTLKELKSKGIIICIATGRAPMTLPDFEDVEFDAYVTFNGSYCYNNNGMIYSNSISNNDVKILLDNASKMNRAVSIASKKRLAANGSDVDLEEYYNIAKLELEVSKDFDKVAEDDIYQVMLGCRKEEYGTILKNTKNVKITAWWDRAVDIIPLDGGKGNGVSKVLEYFGIDRKEAIAFGDGNNDIEMFEVVGNTVAMGNASDELKEIATDVCKTAADDGIYHYCVEKGLI